MAKTRENKNCKLYYIHGYMSDPNSTKGTLFKEKLNAKAIKYRDCKPEDLVISDCLKRIKDELEEERRTKKGQLTKLENVISESRNRLARLEAQIQKLKTREGEAIATMNQTQEALRDVRGELKALRAEKLQAQQQRDNSFEKSVALADQVHQREIEIERLESAARILGVEMVRMRDLLRAYSVNPAEDPAGVLPRVSGQVLAVVGKESVELSIGGDDGLKKGHQLEVFRFGQQNRYIGRIEVMDTAPDKAVCRIVPEYRKGAIRQGDSVTSKFD